MTRPNCLLLAGVLVASQAALAHADMSECAQESRQKSKAVSDLFAAACVIYPQRILKGDVATTAVEEITKSTDKSVADKLFHTVEQRYGVKPRNVNKIVLMFEPSAVAGSIRDFVTPPTTAKATKDQAPPEVPAPAVWISLTTPPDKKALLQAWTRFELREELKRDKAGKVVDRKLVEKAVVPKAKQFQGKTYYDNGETAFFIKDTQIIAASEVVLKRLLSKPLNSPAPATIQGADVMLFVDVGRLRTFVAHAPRVDLPRHIVQLLDLAAKIKRVTISANLTDKPGVTVTAETTDEKTAATLSALLRDRLLPLAKAMYELQRPTSLKYASPAWKPLIEFFDSALDSLKVARVGRNAVVSVNRPDKARILGRLIGRYFAEEHKREQRKVNLQIVSFAMQVYDELNNRLPAHGSDATGKRKGLSWRVHLLPFMDEGELYNQFKLDEAWDSAHNKKLIAKMPSVYKTPGVTGKGHTALHVFVGPGTPFGGKSGLKYGEIKDGHANTFMCVEAGPDKAAVWTKPGGLAFDPKADPWKLIGKTDPVNGFLAVMLDGSVFWMRAWTTPTTLRRLIQHADGKLPGDF